MRQSNYLQTDLEFNGGKFIEDLFDYFNGKYISSAGMVRTGFVGKVDHTYYDTKDSEFQRNGGFLRKLITEDATFDAGNKQIYVEYKKDKASDVRTFKVDKDFSNEELKQRLNLNNNIVPVLTASSIDYHFFFRYIDLRMMITGNAAEVDFIMQAITINPDKTDSQKAVFFSLRDRTPALFNQRIVSELKENVDKCFDAFDTFVSDYQFKIAGDNRYADLMKIVTNEPFFECIPKHKKSEDTSANTSNFAEETAEEETDEEDCLPF